MYVDRWSSWYVRRLFVVIFLCSSRFCNILNDLLHKWQVGNPFSISFSVGDFEDDDEVPATQAHTSSTHMSHTKRHRTDSVNMCRICDDRESNVIALPCAHAVICSECWCKKIVQDDKFCALCYEPVSIARQF